MRILAMGSLAALGVAAAATVVIATAEARWRRGSEAELAAVDRGACAAGPASRDAAVPAPVERYLRWALSIDERAVVRARVRWRGEMRLRPDADWVPFEATQAFSAQPPAFVWDASVRIAPLVRVRVRDAYRAGGASMEASVLGLVPVVDEGGSPELAQSALARWLGEAVWFPSALVPDAVGRLRWEAIDASTARATITDGGVSATADFRFAQGGEIVSMRALRYRDVDGTPVLTSFEGDYGSYERHGGYMVPGSAHVTWLLPEGRFTYWRARPLSIDYDCE